MSDAIVVDTIGKLIRHRYTLTAYCACGHRAPLDLPALAGRLGADHSFLADDLLPRLRCQKCGGRPESLALSPHTSTGSYFTGPATD